MLQGEVSGGVLIVPSRAMYRYLTDRVGNVKELEPYYDLWRLWSRDPNSATWQLLLLSTIMKAWMLNVSLRVQTAGRYSRKAVPARHAVSGPAGCHPLGDIASMFGRTSARS